MTYFCWSFYFQVLTEEQQDALAATPAHPAGLYGGFLYHNVLILKDDILIGVD